MRWGWRRNNGPTIVNEQGMGFGAQRLGWVGHCQPWAQHHKRSIHVNRQWSTLTGKSDTYG